MDVQALSIQIAYQGTEAKVVPRKALPLEDKTWESVLRLLGPLEELIRGFERHPAGESPFRGVPQVG